MTLAVGSLVALLAGSLFVGSLNLWRRGSEIREAESQAAVIVDTMARDVRRASQASSVLVRPTFSAGDAEPLLAVADRQDTATGEPGSDGGAEGSGGGDATARTGAWILYVFDGERREIRRLRLVPVGADQKQTTGGADQMEKTNERVVGLGVVSATVTSQGSGGVLIEVEVRSGRATARHRATAAPRNP